MRNPGVMSDIKFRRSGSPQEEIFDVVNYQTDEKWVKVYNYLVLFNGNDYGNVANQNVY